MNASVETKKAEFAKNINVVIESAAKSVKKVVAVCPDWEVADVCPAYNAMIIYLKLKDTNRDLVIRYQSKVDGWKEEAFETNVASCGSFGLLQDSENLKYYSAIGDFLNHKDMLLFLKETMVFYTKKITELRQKHLK